MAISRELARAYTRIFLVEAAYWTISIGMVFINEDVLSNTLRQDDLTVFITIFQILTSLAILTTLNYITKCYLEPETTSQRRLANKEQLSKVDREPLICDDSDGEDVLFMTPCDKFPSNHLGETGKDSKDDQAAHVTSFSPTNDTDATAKRKSSTGTNDRGAAQESLKHLFIVNIPGRINLETCKVVFPLSILYIGMLLLNNFCLKYVGVAFYFVSRSLTTVFNVVFTYFLINEPVSGGAFACCGFIVLGFMLGIDQESVIGSLSVIGVAFGVASSLFTSLFTIYTKKILAKLDKNIWVLVLYNNMNAILLCTPLLIVHGDVQVLISEKLINPSFWFVLSVSGLMAFFISIVTNASIKYTSPLTHNISGTAKACFQTVIAVIYKSDHKSFLWWLSNITILVASAMYSRIKQKEMERKTLADIISQRNSENRRCSNDVDLGPNDDAKKSRNGLHNDERCRQQKHDSSSSGSCAKSGAVQQVLVVETKAADCCSVKFHSTD